MMNSDIMNPISWMSPKIEVRSTPDEGVGTFVSEPIKKGEVVIIQGGRIVSEEALERPEYEPYWYHCFQVEQDAYICPIELERESADGVFNVNHSCEPTCGFRGQITLISLHDLAVGDQITFDYVMTDVDSTGNEWEDMTCLCGTKSFRKIVGGSDWKIKELQERYKGYFSPYVQELIDRNKE